MINALSVKGYRSVRDMWLELGPLNVLTGFLDKDEKAQGRPAMLAVDKTGALLVSDDVGNIIWRVKAKG